MTTIITETKNLLLIEQSLIDIIEHLLVDKVDYVVFDIGKDYDDLLSKITDNIYENIGIFSHGNEISFNFVEPITNQENSKFNFFLKSLRNKTSFKNLDLLSCFFGVNLGYLAL